jgi:hypothetical protein
MSTTIQGDLHNTDYSDKIELVRTARAYKYEVSASGGGTVSFKMEYFQPALLGETGGRDQWWTIEDKSKVASGATLTGSFTVPRTQLTSTTDTDSTRIRATFSREFASTGVDYTLLFYPE